MNLSHLQEFKMKEDRWSTYVSRLRAWFEIHDVKPAEYSKHLVAVVGTEPLDLMIDLCYPEKPEKTSFESIVKLVEDHLAPKRSVVAERMIFRSCKQSDSQTVTDYLVQLKKLSKTCVFTTPEILKENLRDQFVFGISSDKIRQRLLTEVDLSFDRAVTIALSLEAAVRDSQEATNTTCKPSEQVHGIGDSVGSRGRAYRGARPAHGGSAMAGRGRARQPAAVHGGSGGQQQHLKCYRCGQPHRADKCSFINAECFVCGIRGHIAKVCRSRKRTGVHKVAAEQVSPLPSSEEEDDDVYQMRVHKEDDERWLTRV